MKFLDAENDFFRLGEASANAHGTARNAADIAPSDIARDARGPVKPLLDGRQDSSAATHGGSTSSVPTTPTVEIEAPEQEDGLFLDAAREVLHLPKEAEKNTSKRPTAGSRAPTSRGAPRSGGHNSGRRNNRGGSVSSQSESQENDTIRRGPSSSTRESLSTSRQSESQDIDTNRRRPVPSGGESTSLSRSPEDGEEEDSPAFSPGFREPSQHRGVEETPRQQSHTRHRRHQRRTSRRRNLKHRTQGRRGDRERVRDGHTTRQNRTTGVAGSPDGNHSRLVGGLLANHHHYPAAANNSGQSRNSLLGMPVSHAVMLLAFSVIGFLVCIAAIVWAYRRRRDYPAAAPESKESSKSYADENYIKVLDNVPGGYLAESDSPLSFGGGKGRKPSITLSPQEDRRMHRAVYQNLTDDAVSQSSMKGSNSTVSLVHYQTPHSGVEHPSPSPSPSQKVHFTRRKTDDSVETLLDHMDQGDYQEPADSSRLTGVANPNLNTTPSGSHGTENDSAVSSTSTSPPSATYTSSDIPSTPVTPRKHEAMETRHQEHADNKEKDRERARPKSRRSKMQQRTSIAQGPVGHGMKKRGLRRELSLPYIGDKNMDTSDSSNSNGLLKRTSLVQGVATALGRAGHDNTSPHAGMDSESGSQRMSLWNTIVSVKKKHETGQNGIYTKTLPS